MPSAPTGTIHQKRGCAKTLERPRHCTARPTTRGLAGTSGTRSQIAAATTNVAAASTTNTERHDVTVSAASSGVVASSAPLPPATIIHPASEDCRSTGYHVAMAFSGDIRQAAQPAPISARAATSPASPSAAANASAPRLATTRSTGSTRRGP